MSNFSLAIRGDYRTVMAHRKKALLTALREATIQSAATVKNQARADIVRAGMGRKLAGTVQDEIYPPRGLAYSPSAEIFSKAPQIVAPHALVGTIRPRLAEALLIPIKGSPAEKIRAGRGQTKVEVAQARFGELTMIFPKGSSPILGVRVTDKQVDRRARGLRVRKLDREGPKNFLGLCRVVRQTFSRKRLRTFQIFEQGRRRHPQRVVHHLRIELEKSMDATAIK